MFKDLRGSAFRVALVAALVLGALIWVLSPLITGHKEAWDSQGGYYFLSLMLAGFVPAAIEPKYFWLWPLVVIVGQQSYLLAANGLQSLMAIVFILFYSMQCVKGAVLGAIVSIIAKEISSEVSAPAAQESQNQAIGNKYRWLFLALSVVVFGAATILLGRGFLAIQGVAASSAAKHPYWDTIMYVPASLIYVAPFFLLGAETMKWSHKAQVFTRQRFLSIISGWASVFSVYLVYKFLPFTNTYFTVIYLLSIPVIPKMLHGSYSLYSRIYGSSSGE